MTRQTVSRWALLVGALVLTMVLAGCGGDDGVSQSVHDQLQQERDAEEAARLEAERQAAEEEAARIAAEEAAAAARAAAEQAAAEAAAAEEARQAAEAARLARIEEARQAIATAETASAAQAAYDVVKDDVTVTEGVALQTAVDMRIDELETMASAAAQKEALMMAAGNIDTSDLMTADDIAAATTAINTLKAALAAASDVSDADKAMYQAMVDAGEAAVMTAQGMLDHAAQTMVLADAVTDLQAIDLSDLMTQADVDAANTAIYALEMALEAATELSAAEKSAALVELATARRTVMAAQGRVDVADQKAALATAVMALETINLDGLMTQQQIDDAEKAIVALDLALEMATDLTSAETLDATVDVTVAKRKLAAAKTALADNIDDQKMALTTAGTALGGIDLEDLDTADKIAAAQKAIDDLQMALDDATHVSDADKAMYQDQLDDATDTVRMAQTGMDSTGRMAAQRKALTDTMAAAQAAVNMVDDDATDAQVMAADDAITALQAAITGAVDLPEGSTDMAQGALDSLTSTLEAAKTSRMAAMADADRKKNEANAATAAKLYAGISTPVGSNASPVADNRSAAYNDADTAIVVLIGDDATPTLATDGITLSEDEDTMVADNHGWEGKRYADAPGGDMVEAIVYSNVGEPTMGAKFNSGNTGANNVGFATTAGVLAVEAATNLAARIVSPSFDHTAGYKTFNLPDPNLGGATNVTISGSYYGVAGTYSCTPTIPDDGCRVNKAADGYTLVLTGTGAGTWTFTATNPEDRVTETPDSIYASYGWWLHKSEDGMTFTASAFADDKGDVPDATGITALMGTATYMGGAAGKYALHSSTGGTNDAGHFTARATLQADFDDDMITGTIDNFMGADGMSRDWSVELMKSAIGNTGLIRQSDDDNTDLAASDPGAMTKWTIDGTAAAAAGQWSGSLQDNGDDDGVPQVATGTFYSEYGGDGRLVGGFGVKKQ